MKDQNHSNSSMPQSNVIMEEVEEGEPWLVSYADMMTLLFGFFVLMYSFAAAKNDESSENWIKVRKELAAFFGGEKAAEKSDADKESGDSKDLFSPNVGIESSARSGSRKNSQGIYDDAKSDIQEKDKGKEESSGQGTYVSMGDDLTDREFGGAIQLKKVVDTENSLELIIGGQMLFMKTGTTFLPEGELVIAKICERISSMSFPYFLGITAFSQSGDKSLSPPHSPAGADFPTSESIQRAKLVLDKLARCAGPSNKGSRMTAMGIGYVPLSAHLRGILEDGVIIRLNVALDF